MLPNLTNSVSSQKSNYNKNQSNNNCSSLKRSSSMIFRIEHILPSSSSSSKAADKTTEHEQAVAVFVAQFTTKGTVSDCLSTDALMQTSCTNVLEDEEQPQRQHVFCNLSQGLLFVTPIILRQIRLAEDIHSYNALLEMHKGQVRLRVTQDLNEGDEIVAWFSEQISILMSIPFLTLANIQG